MTEDRNDGLTGAAAARRSGDADPRRRNAGRSALGALALVALMGGLSFAAVPFYDWFCRVTGFSGTTQRAEAASETVLDQTIVVRFDASTNRDMPWRFKPAQTQMRVRIGETAVAYYVAENPTDQSITGTATFNVTPLQLGGYFNKIACFCFEEQTLAPGERVDMPVQFFVDPALVEDAEYGDVSTITLSYTFFRLQEQDRTVGVAADAAKGAVN